jgi:flagellar motor switch protein FliN/FliY
MTPDEALTRSLLGTSLRVWAELGRTRMELGRVVGLGPGGVVELDRQAEEPVDVYVNGLRYAVGRLVVADGGDWAVRIESVLGREALERADGRTPVEPAA